MARSDELDLLSTDTQAQLGDATITVNQNRPAGAIDPDTRDRTVDVGAANPAVLAVEGPIEPFNNGTRWVMRRRWVVLASAVGFRPSREGTVTDAAGRVWNIASVREVSNAREYEIDGELAG